MTEDIISSEWSNLALDSETISLEAFEHDLVIGGNDADKLTTTPTNVSYSPTVNKAKNMTVDVPPNSLLEDLSYLGEPIELYVDKELAFTGEIIEVQTQQKEGQDYTINARPEGKKLHGSDVERTANNEIVSDTVSKLVDRFNSVADEHENLAGTDAETLNDVLAVGGNVREATSNSATATYSLVGSDLSQVTSVYVKAYVPSDETLTLNLIASSGTDSKNMSGMDKNVYGEWERFTDFSDISESFDVEFGFEQDCVLMDWVVVLNETVQRDTTSPDISPLDENTPFYTWTDDELETNTETSGNGIAFDSGRPRNRQITSWWEGTPFPEFSGEDDYVGGVAARLENTASPSEFDIQNPSDPMEQWGLYARVKPFELFVNRNSTHTNGGTPYDDDWASNASASTTQVAVEDSSVEITGDTNKDFQWQYKSPDQISPLEFSGQAYLNTTSPNILWAITAGAFASGHDNDDGYGIDIDSSGLSLERLDDGSPETQLDENTSYSPQSGEWFDFQITIDGDNISAQITDSTGTYSVGATDTNHTIFGEFSVFTGTNHYIDDLFAQVGGSIKNASINFTLDGNTSDYGISLGDGPFREWRWAFISGFDFTPDTQEIIENSVQVTIEATDSSETAFMISPLVLMHREADWDITNYSTSLHEAQGHLDGPPVYSDGSNGFGNTVRFSEVVSQENISEATVDATITNTTDVLSEWGISQVIDTSATDFPQPSNSSTSTRNFPYPGVQHIMQITLSSSGLRNDASPRKGYNPQRVDDIAVTVSTNDLDILFDQDLSDNRLALMNSLASESTVLFRWEGDLARIFHNGQEETNVNLRSENIRSSVSIEDVYRYCEVIGLHNVRSGKLESTNAPSYVDDEKVIRDDTVENDTDAISRARQFLSEHGTVKFSGRISTMPTFAPVGAELDGSNFNHGQSMIITGVSYGKRQTTISLGYDKNIATEIIALEKSTSDTKGRTTGKGMKIPVGEEQI